MTSGQQDIAGHLDRHLTTELGRLFAATLGGVVLIYLVIDFADRAHGFHGRAWGKSVLELYANKAAVVSYQLAPAALIIAAALLVTLLSRRGELIALYGLGVRPLRLALPIAGFATAGATGRRTTPARPGCAAGKGASTTSAPPAMADGNRRRSSRSSHRSGSPGASTRAASSRSPR